MALSHALRAASLLALIALATAFVAAPAFAVTYTVSVQTDRTSYTSGQSIMISGAVSPAPGANTAVIVTITNPDGKTVVDIGDNQVNPTTGAYNQTTVAGGTAHWIAGTYTVNATWGGYGSTATKTTTFNFAIASTTSSSSSTTTTTSTTSASTSKTTTSSSSSTTTTSPPTTTSSSATVLPTTSSSSSSSTTQSTTETEGGGLGSLTYVIVAAVAIVVVGLGIVLWRRRVASGFSGKPTAP